MSYFGISGIRSTYTNPLSMYSQNRIRNLSARRQNTSPRTVRTRYNSASDTSPYNAYGMYHTLENLQSTKNDALKLHDSVADCLGIGNEEASIDSAVKNFVDSYNNVVTDADRSSNQTVSGLFGNLSRMTRSMQRSLDEIGISVERDGSLSLDEKAFKEADTEKVKALMGSSYMRSVASYASRMYSAAETARASSQLSASRNAISNLFGGYNSYGSLLGGFGSYGSLLGSLFNGYF